MMNMIRISFKDAESAQVITTQEFNIKDNFYAIPNKEDIVDFNDKFYRVKQLVYHYMLVREEVYNPVVQSISIFIEKITEDTIEF